MEFHLRLEKEEGVERRGRQRSEKNSGSRQVKPTLDVLKRKRTDTRSEKICMLTQCAKTEWSNFELYLEIVYVFLLWLLTIVSSTTMDFSVLSKSHSLDYNSCCFPEVRLILWSLPVLHPYDSHSCELILFHVLELAGVILIQMPLCQ